MVGYSVQQDAASLKTALAVILGQRKFTVCWSYRIF